MICDAQIDGRQPRARLGEIDADPKFGKIAVLRRTPAEAISILHGNPKAVQTFSFDAHAHGPLPARFESITEPGTAAVASAPNLDLRDAHRADRFNLVFQS